MPPKEVMGILFYRCPFVCLYVCPSVCPKLNVKTLHFLLLLNQLIYKALIRYESTSHQYTSAGTKVKAICKCQSQISKSHSQKACRFRGISVSQTHLVFQDSIITIFLYHLEMMLINFSSIYILYVICVCCTIQDFRIIVVNDTAKFML